jgi:hypothetical protein
MRMRTLGQWSSLLGARGREMLDGRGGSGRRKLYTCQLAIQLAIQRAAKDSYLELCACQ